MTLVSVCCLVPLQFQGKVTSWFWYQFIESLSLQTLGRKLHVHGFRPWRQAGTHISHSFIITCVYFIYHSCRWLVIGPSLIGDWRRQQCQHQPYGTSAKLQSCSRLLLSMVCGVGHGVCKVAHCTTTGMVPTVQGRAWCELERGV